MALLKKLYSVQANSLLESVVALSIISVCLYIAIMVYTAVFTAKTSARYYNFENKINEAFFLLQIGQDSLSEIYNNDNWTINEDGTGTLKQISVTYKDSIGSHPPKNFYIIKNE